jgi:hypothetical protein
LGCWKNWISIMGPAKCLLCWFFPVPIKREWGGFDWPRRVAGKERNANREDEELSEWTNGSEDSERPKII